MIDVVCLIASYCILIIAYILARELLHVNVHAHACMYGSGGSVKI